MVYDMKTSLKSILISIISFVPMMETAASHIVGGDASYTFLRHNNAKTEATYEVTFTIYRDENGIGYEPRAAFGVYKLTDTGIWITETVVENVPLGNVESFSATSDPCSMQTISDIKVESGTYTFEISLPIIDNYYKIAYQKCCRNHVINNIKDAGTTGAVYDIKISAESQKMGNSSPRFTAYPPTFICVNETINYKHSAMDPDSDELRYSFCAPYVAGGVIDYEPQCCDCQNPEVGFCPPPFDNVIYNPGYSYENPIGGTGANQISIDPKTGVITGTPDQVGSYVVGVCVEEIRDGETFTKIRRDFQFNVVQCTPALTAIIQSDSSYVESINGEEKTIHAYNLCHDESLTIINNSTDLKYIEDYHWVINDSLNTIVYDEAGATLKDLYIDNLNPGQYSGRMILNDTQACSDTAFISINVEDEIIPEFTYEYDPCYMSPIHFSPVEFDDIEKIVSWNWDFGDGTSVDAMAGDYTYASPEDYQVILTVIDDNSCTYAYEMYVDYNPLTEMPELEIIETNEIICDGESVSFDGELKYDEGIYEYIVPTQDKLCDSILYRLYLDIYPEATMESLHEYLCPGETIVYNGIEIDEPSTHIQNIAYKGASCDSIIRELTVENAILPQVFLPSDTTITIRSEFTLPFDIIGEYASMLWSPEELLDCSRCESPTTQLNDNQYFVLEIESADGCIIEKGINVIVEENNDFYLANVLSSEPGDNILYVQSRSEISYEYDMYIYDRYGNVIHECLDATCNDSSKGWTPTNLNPGVFVYVVQFKDEYYQETIAGSVTILE